MTGSRGFPLYKWRTCQHAMFSMELSPRALNLFNRLVDHHNEKTGLCFPGEEHLSLALGCTERTIRNLLRELERAKLIKTSKGPECPPRNYYTINFFKGGTAEYRTAQIQCLKRRKEISGKSENKPQKYRAHLEAKKGSANKAAKTTYFGSETQAQTRQRLEKILAKKLGGGSIAWEAFMELGASIEEMSIAVNANELGFYKAIDLLLSELKKS